IPLQSSYAALDIAQTARQTIYRHASTGSTMGILTTIYCGATMCLIPGKKTIQSSFIGLL
ncbi:MAG: hypothetical protein ACOYZ8_07415, partial [Chloroflexota bacterium]